MALECLFSGIGSSIVGEIFGSTFGGIGRQLGYLTSYKRNLKNLEDEAENLKVQKSKMDKMVKAAIDNCEEIYDDVKRRQEEVDKICKEAEDILGDENHARIKCTFSGVFLNIRQRHRLSREAKKMGESIAKIKDSIKFENISCRPKPKSNFDNKDFVIFATRNETVSRITKKLGDANIRMIWVYGMSGSGKTTLVREIVRRVLHEGVLFSDAVMVTVSRTPNLETIQQEVARKLGLNFDKEASLSERADLLKERLKKEEKLLLILDDVWDGLNLEEVGIAFESDAKGCKILLTSRLERVFGFDVGVNEKFKVGQLSREEAWEWFSNLVGHDMVKDNKFQDLGKGIVEKCECLPIAIKIIAHQMKGRDLGSWSDALEQLRRPNLEGIDGMREQVYSPIIFSFNSLQKDPKSLFLLCGVLQQNSSIKIEDLVRYAFGCGLFESSYTTLQDARNRVHHIITMLKDRCMLLDGDSHDMVRLHDLVHDVAISFAKEKFMYCFKNDAEVEERLRRNALKDPVAIILPDDVHLLCQTLECKEIGIIRMPHNQSLQIPDRFFESTKDLRVLDLWYSNKLPSSLCSLGNLSTLCLRYAGPESIAQIGELQNLEILDLSWSKIEELPREIEQLTRLRMLDLRSCSQLEVIQPSVIQHLVSLEELYVTNSFTNWDQVDVVHNVGERASLMELQDLAKLTTLHLDIVDVKMLPKHLSFRGNLERYKISVGYAKQTFNIIDDCSRYLGICKELHESGDQLQKRLHVFLKKPQVLYLNGIDQGVDEILYELSEKGYPELKQLRLERDEKIRCLINSSNMREIHPPARSVCCMLESLYLNELSNLEKICDGEVTKESFQRLRDIEVHNCSRLKNLLPSSIKKLEKLTIFACDGMEEIVENYEDENEEVIEIFPQLLSLSLIRVPKLSQFCSSLKKNHMSRKEPEDSILPFFSHKLVSLPSLSKLQLEHCDFKKIWDDLPPPQTSFRNLTILIVENCHFMESLFSSAVAASFEQLEFLRIENCKGMKEIVSRTEGMDKISFHRLNRLILTSLGKLTAFSSSISIYFPALTVLSIRNCYDFKTFISKSTENSMPSLFNEKASFPSLEIFDIYSLEKLEMLWQKEQGSSDSFCRLKTVNVSYCRSLKSLIFPSASFAKGLPELQQLHIEDCRIEEIFGKEEELETVPYEFVFPLLKHMWLIDLPNLVSFYRGPHTSRFPLLTNLEVNRCPKMKAFCASESMSFQGTYGSLFFTKNFLSFPELKYLTLAECHFEQICHYPLFHCLTKLEVVECHFLKSLFSSATAAVCSKQLCILRVKDCNMMEEIISNDKTTDDMSFSKLKTLSLQELPNLMKFSSQNFIEFRMCTSLRIMKCPKFKTLVSKSSQGQPSNAKPICLFNEKFAFPSLKSVYLDGMDSLEMIWQYELSSSTADFYCKLEDVKIENCKNLTKIFLCTLQRLQNLRWLRISNCERVEEIFAIQMSNPDHQETITFLNLEHVAVYKCPSLKSIFPAASVAFNSLKEVKISGADSLKMIWPYELMGCSTADFLEKRFEIQMSNLDHQETLTFPNLEDVEVSACSSLKSIFPASAAKGMLRLGKLKIRNCWILEEIFGKEEGLEPTELVFPQLQTMELQKLPNLLSFYGRPHSSRFPLLRTLEVGHCLKIKVLSASKLLSFQGTYGSLFITNKLAFPSLKSVYLDGMDAAFPSLKSVYLYGMDSLEMIWQCEVSISTADSFCNLEKVKVMNCKNLKKIFSFRLQRELHNLRSLTISNCEMVEEIFEIQMSSPDHQETLTFPNLEEVYVSACPSMKSIFPASVAFPSLKSLYLNGMACLEIWQFELSSSTADFYCKLEVVKIENCKNLKKIFSLSLQRELHNLRSLTISYCEKVEEIFEIQMSSPSHQETLTFPNLEDVDVSACYKMKSIFPASVAKGLFQLRKLKIHDCWRLEEIVGKDEGLEPTEFEFPQLQTLDLQKLPNLVSFCGGSPSSRFPLLGSLVMKCCLKMKASSAFINQTVEMIMKMMILKSMVFEDDDLQDKVDDLEDDDFED
ncbi:hypothetical protein FNV43_RR25376 [Rhamnella rubrinervis]|uniref:AAA+ ATPase domain-containing protein n=1 Tax=Rhamnella rubrinervis TaxID=2594499 RepID=A0A8K0DSB6_9ROSA|nr:hypothetical protein FNV43_RR25376 [Rhamnella rubrinervis]